MGRGEVLVIEAPDAYAAALERGGRARGCRVRTGDWEMARREGEAAASLWVAALDGARPGVEARLDAIREALERRPVVVLAANLRVDHVLALADAGASDVIEIPADPDAVASRALGALAPGEGEAPRDGLTGGSAAMARVRRQAAAVAGTPSTVLLTGETGCGKGVAAREIHRLSKRRRGPFVHVDCAALAGSVIDSELFGHERGAFTGAVGRRIGRFERAAGGTIFLDEVGDLEPALQAKLLRVLQDREFERVGGSTTHAMTARVIAATHRDLRRAVTEGFFRADLLFRLSVFEIRIPPLRERRDDIPALAGSLVRQLARRAQVEAPVPGRAFLERLASHAWPGNVRELMNLLERLVIEKPGGRLLEGDLDAYLAMAQTWHLAQIAAAGREPEPAAGERERIAAALVAERGNVSRTARRLGLARSTLRYRLRQHGL